MHIRVPGVRLPGVAEQNELVRENIQRVGETHKREESHLERGREDGRGRTRDQPGWETVEEERFVSNRVRFFFCGDEFEQFFCFVVLE